MFLEITARKRVSFSWFLAKQTPSSSDPSGIFGVSWSVRKKVCFSRCGYWWVMAIQAQLYSENIGFSLGGSQEWVDNGCGGFNGSCFNLQQHQQQYMQQLQSQQEQIQSQRNYQNFFLDNSLMGSTLKNSPNYGSSQSLASQFDNQRQEIDQFITLQVTMTPNFRCFLFWFSWSQGFSSDSDFFFSVFTEWEIEIGFTRAEEAATGCSDAESGIKGIGSLEAEGWGDSESYQ